MRTGLLLQKVEDAFDEISDQLPDGVDVSSIVMLSCWDCPAFIANAGEQEKSPRDGYHQTQRALCLLYDARTD